MRAWEVHDPGPLESRPIRFVSREPPIPGYGEVRIAVSACGVCRTDLHIAEGDLQPRRPDVVPGHEVVGTVDAIGEGVTRFAPGEKIGIAWLRYTCGTCKFCTRGGENLCPFARFTGWDEDGGYAEYALVLEDFAYSLPDEFDDVHAAPLLCSGIIGYRALRKASLPPGGRLGIYGFGSSAHIAAQVAIFEGTEVHVITRSERARELALKLGAASASDGLAPPEPLDSAILFAPSGALVPAALEALDRGGTLSIAGIHLSPIPALDYEKHLFNEKRLVSVTANTRQDGRDLLEVAAKIPIDVSVSEFSLDRAAVALRSMARGELTGAAVLKVS